MNIVTRNRISAAVASIVAVLVLTMMMLGNPAHVAAQDAPTLEPYITVVIADGDDTVSWSDPDICSSDYNIYLAESPRHNVPETSPTHLGSAASGSTEATLAISGGGQSPKVDLYCGAYDADSSQNELIASTRLSLGGSGGFRAGTYSSAPLTALSISSGTLSPAFDRGIGEYALEVPGDVEVASDVEVITLDPTVLTGYQFDLVRNPGPGIISTCGWFGNDCTYSYFGDGTTTAIILSDADTETEGFQVELSRSEKRLGIGVHKGNVGAGARLYYLTVNSENSPATGAPTISGTAQVGEVLTADTSGIADADGLDNATFSYQWLSSRDTAISGATGSTYTLVSTDLGKIIKVKVTFTDDEGNEESLTSAATASVADSSNSAGHRITRHQRDGAGRADADGEHLRHCR